MVFTSFEFIIFAVVFFSVFPFLSGAPKRLYLLVASYAFYGWWDWRFLGLMLLSTVIDYTCGLQITKASAKAQKIRWLWFSMAVNLGILGYFKYANFFITEFAALTELFGLGIHISSLNVILPLGISFYTFQTMSYSIDVYRGEIKPARNFTTFALFVSFFPQLVAGPIERAGHLISQLETSMKPRLDQVKSGVLLFLMGLFKKLAIANVVAPVVDASFSNGFEGGAAPVMIATYLFAFQIYADFSGYSDMARGLARCMGVNLVVNFNTPYLVTSITHFWRHWHISLSNWIRDYLYIPLGGNRCGSFRSHFNLLATMALAGLWHGAGWAFIVWGLYHGFLLVFERLTGYVNISFEKKIWTKVLAIVIAFHITCVGWYLFRVGSMAGEMQLDMLVTGFAMLDLHWLSDPMAVFVTCILGSTVIACQMLSKFIDESGDLSFKKWYLSSAILVLLVCGFGQFNSNEFIYFQF